MFANIIKLYTTDGAYMQTSLNGTLFGWEGLGGYWCQWFNILPFNGTVL